MVTSLTIAKAPWLTNMDMATFLTITTVTWSSNEDMAHYLTNYVRVLTTQNTSCHFSRPIATVTWPSNGYMSRDFTNYVSLGTDLTTCHGSFFDHSKRDMALASDWLFKMATFRDMALFSTIDNRDMAYATGTCHVISPLQHVTWPLFRP